MYIYDAALDDSDFHNGSSIEETTPDKYTDGSLSLYSNMDTSEYTAGYSFSRRSGEYSSFSLTPDKTSFYKLTNKASKSANVLVSYEKRTLWWSETISVEQEKDGTYLLDGGTEYTIETYGVQSGGYNFTVEQDNWVYAPNGGLWKIIDKYLPVYGAQYYPSSELYITPKLLVEATCGKIDNDYKEFTVYTQNDIEKVMPYIADAYKSEVNAILGTAVSIGGFVLLFIPEPSSKVVAIILKATGTSLTVLGGTTSGYSIIEELKIKRIQEVISEGNMHISYSMYGIANYNNYNPWNSNNYICKLNIGIPGTVYTDISYQQVQKLCGFRNYDN